jgi:hypothetical protein
MGNSYVLCNIKKACVIFSGAQYLQIQYTEAINPFSKITFSISVSQSPAQQFDVQTCSLSDCYKALIYRCKKQEEYTWPNSFVALTLLLPLEFQFLNF